MTDDELQEHIVLLRRVRTDFRHVEAKLAWGGLPKRLWETLSAFANTSGGGVIILGLDEGANFEVVGVENPRKTLQEGAPPSLSYRCRPANPTIPQSLGSAP
jgi:ATP-dependent DNA helicase RecG